MPVVFNGSLPKLTAAGVMTRPAKPFSPLPARETLADRTAAFEAMLSVAAAVPAAVGANVTAYAALAAGAIFCGKAGPVTENSLLDTAIPEISSTAVPVLEILMV